MGKAYIKIRTGEKKASSINGAAKIGKSHAERVKLDFYLSSYRKINSKWIKDLNGRSETMHCIEQSIGTKLIDLGLRKKFMNLTSEAKEAKAEINEWGYIKLKTFLYSKRNCQQNKNATHKIGEDICKHQVW